MSESTSMSSHPPILEVRDLAVSFATVAGKRVRAVEGVNLALHAGRTLAVVGESGSGKSVTALSILRLLPPPPQAKIERGEIIFDGRDLLKLPAREMLRVRGGGVAMIFQEPMTSLNPVFSIGDQIIEAIRRHQHIQRRAEMHVATAALREVGIDDPARRLHAYPHQFSGGMRQRVMIAMALACQPRVVLADEPTTALDVTVAAQVLDLLRALQLARGLAVMLITHDLGIVRQRADDVYVMYRGRIVERGGVRDVLDRPMHPYTRALLECRPRMRSDRRVYRLNTIADVVDRDRKQRLQNGLRTWWPSTEGSDKVGAEVEVVRMIEVEAGHEVACVDESAIAKAV